MTPLWYKPRRYPHFDRPLSPDAAVALVSNPKRIAKHAFLPFIAFSINSYRYKRKLGKVEVKSRPVAFAAHGDAQIYSYYSHLLHERYEAELERRKTSHCVLAYRRFTPPKCNIHFAHEAFDEIKSRNPCIAVALDLSDFFGSLDHQLLKAQWCSLIGEKELPADHYAVFKSITKWACVDQRDLYKALNIGRRRQKTVRSPLTTPREYRALRKSTSVVKTHRANAGIPQGSPISAVLSNVYMLDIDTQMCSLAASASASYRRYSDDILLIGSEEAVKLLEDELLKLVSAKRLAVNHGKTVRSVFQAGLNGNQSTTCPCQYLGFTFDGRSVLLRSQTLAKYWHRMLRGIKAARRAALSAARQGGRRRLFRRELYARYSHLGATSDMLNNPRFKNLRNSFIRYARRASAQLGSPQVLKQLRKHWLRLNQELESADVQ